MYIIKFICIESDSDER